MHHVSLPPPAKQIPPVRRPFSVPFLRRFFPFFGIFSGAFLSAFPRASFLAFSAYPFWAHQERPFGGSRRFFGRFSGRPFGVFKSTPLAFSLGCGARCPHPFRVPGPFSGVLRPQNRRRQRGFRGICAPFFCARPATETRQRGTRARLPGARRHRTACSANAAGPASKNTAPGATAAGSRPCGGRAGRALRFPPVNVRSAGRT